MKRWLIIPAFILLVVSTVWAYTLTHTGPQIDQGVAVALSIGSTTGVIQSDGADNITGLGLVTTVGSPGSDTNIPTEKAVRDGLDAVTGTGEANIGANTGDGIGKVFRDKQGVTLNFKSIKAGANIQIANNPDDIEISTTSAVGEANIGANVGSGQATIYRDKTGTVLNFKRLQAGANIQLTNSASEVIISSTGGGTGSGDVTGPESATVGAVSVFAATTGKVIKEVPVTIDDSGNMAGVNSLDQNPTPDPQWVFRDSDAPGADKDVGGVAAQYLSGADGSENSVVELQTTLNGSRQAIGTSFVSPSLLSDNAFKGDLVFNYNCAATIVKGELVHIDNAANPWVLASSVAASNAFPAFGIAVTNCTAGNVGTVMTRGYMRNNTGYSGYTIGTPVYMGVDGALSSTASVASGDAIQIVGFVLPSNVIRFDFSRPYSNVQ